MKINLEVRPNYFVKVDNSSIEELSSLLEEPFCFYLEDIRLISLRTYEPVFSEPDIQELWDNLKLTL